MSNVLALTGAAEMYIIMFDITVNFYIRQVIRHMSSSVFLRRSVVFMSWPVLLYESEQLHTPDEGIYPCSGTQSETY